MQEEDVYFVVPNVMVACQGDLDSLERHKEEARKLVELERWPSSGENWDEQMV